MLKKIIQGWRDFVRGLKIIFGKPESGRGNRQLARMSMIIMGQMSYKGKNAVRTQLIKSIDGDFKRWAKKGGKEKIDKEIRSALDTPEYVRLLHRVDLNEGHLRAMEREAIKKYAH